ncbi:hypothetical protein PENTCL1PPCAC_3197, partial [Pristionchus entomophagus]
VAPLPQSASLGARLEKALLISICVLGIFFNFLTFFKNKATRKRGSSATRVSLSLLRVMAGADTLCLAAMLFTLAAGKMGWRGNWLLGMFVCKVNLFIVHSASAFSLYCWLVLSLVRYVAVFSPFKHLRLNREPILAVVLLAIVISAAESWLLFDIQYNMEKGACMNGHDDDLERKIQITEIVLTYFVPLGIITICDVKVLFFRDTWSRDNSLSAKTDPMKKLTATDSFERQSMETLNVGGLIKQNQEPRGVRRQGSRRARRAQFRALQRTLLISIFDLLLNLPNYLFRLFLNVIDPETLHEISQDQLDIAESVSQILYFAQFSLNAFYLICIIYDTPKQREPTRIEQRFAQHFLKKNLLTTQQSTIS